MMWNIVGRMGSREHVVGMQDKIICRISSVDRRKKSVKERGMCSGGIVLGVKD